MTRIAVLLALVAAGCTPYTQAEISQPVMNPDGTAFAYTIEFRRYEDWTGMGTPNPARLELWSYDFARRSSPHRVGRWSFDPKWSVPVPTQWTDEGIEVKYMDGTRTIYELIDPENGRRRRSVATPADSPHSLYPPRFEQVGGEFFVWDPVTLKKTLLFALPIEEGGSNRDSRLRDRQLLLRQDGVQDIAEVRATHSPTGVTLRVRTFATRPANFERKYRLRVQVQVSETERDRTFMREETVVETTVSPKRDGDTLEVFVPFAKLRRTLRSDMRGYWPVYSAIGQTSLIPDSLAGDELLPPGIRDGRVTETRTEFEIPVR